VEVVSGLAVKRHCSLRLGRKQISSAESVYSICNERNRGVCKSGSLESPSVETVARDGIVYCEGSALFALKHSEYCAWRPLIAENNFQFSNSLYIH
jgi:hypothetical protein